MTAPSHHISKRRTFFARLPVTSISIEHTCTPTIQNSMHNEPKSPSVPIRNRLRRISFIHSSAAEKTTEHPKKRERTPTTKRRASVRTWWNERLNICSCFLRPTGSQNIYGNQIRMSLFGSQHCGVLWFSRFLLRF